jgi:DNA-binding transcriptional regulator YdaS (Cro superfamily)
MLPVEQIERFTIAVELLGGQHNAARILQISDRMVSDLCNGQRPLDIGFLRNISRALIMHADACRLMERRLSPAFLDNVLPGQG